MYDYLKIFGLLSLFVVAGNMDSASTSRAYCMEDSNKIELEVQKCKPSPDYSYSTDPDYLNSFPDLVVPVVFWGVNKSDGSHDDALTEAKVEESIALLNSAFEEMKICFELKAIEQIKDSKLYWTDYYKFNRYVKDKYPASEKVLNIYVPYRFTNFDNNLRGGKWSTNQLSVNMLNYNTGILPHEVGHIFGLLHTHTGEKGRNCERITRDEKDLEYNAKCAGDRVTDTSAMPNLYSNFHMINEKCEYDGNLKNCEGQAYQLTENDVRNFMAYTQHSCRSTFTIGQGVRAREYIDKFVKSERIKFISNSKVID